MKICFKKNCAKIKKFMNKKQEKFKISEKWLLIKKEKQKNLIEKLNVKKKNTKIQKNKMKIINGKFIKEIKKFKI